MVAGRVASTFLALHLSRKAEQCAQGSLCSGHMAIMLSRGSAGSCWVPHTSCNRFGSLRVQAYRRPGIARSSRDRPDTSQKSLDTLDLLLGSADAAPGLVRMLSPDNLTSFRPFLTALLGHLQRIHLMRLPRHLWRTLLKVKTRTCLESSCCRAQQMKQLLGSKLKPAQGELHVLPTGYCCDFLLCR